MQATSTVTSAYAVGIPSDTYLFAAPLPGDGTREWTWEPGSTTLTRLPKPARDPLEFVRPLLDLGMDPLGACVLYNDCEKDLGVALALLALARLVEQDPQTLLRDKKWRKAALRELDGFLRGPK